MSLPSVSPNGEWKNVESESTLEALQKRDNYQIQKVVKYFLLGIFLGLVLVFCYLFIERLLTDPIFKNNITDRISENIMGIIFFALGLFGINMGKKN